MNKDVVIETERLILRQWNMKDIDDMVEGLNNIKEDMELHIKEYIKN